MSPLRLPLYRQRQSLRFWWTRVRRKLQRPKCAWCKSDEGPFQWFSVGYSGADTTGTDSDAIPFCCSCVDGLKGDADSTAHWAVKALKQDGEYGVDYGMDDPEKAVGIGSCFNIMPSGKFYTPFAHSNVNEAEATADAIWLDQFEGSLESKGAYYYGHDSDPTQLVVARAIESYQEANVRQ